MNYTDDAYINCLKCQVGLCILSETIESHSYHLHTKTPSLVQVEKFFREAKDV